MSQKGKEEERGRPYKRENEDRVWKERAKSLELAMGEDLLAITDELRLLLARRLLKASTPMCHSRTNRP